MPLDVPARAKRHSGATSPGGRLRKVCLCNREDPVHVSPAPPFPAPESAISLPPLDCLRFFEAAGRRGRRRSAPGQGAGPGSQRLTMLSAKAISPGAPGGGGSRPGGDGPELPKRFRLDGGERLNAALTVEAMTAAAGSRGRTSPDDPVARYADGTRFEAPSGEQRSRLAQRCAADLESLESAGYGAASRSGS